MTISYALYLSFLCYGICFIAVLIEVHMVVWCWLNAILSNTYGLIHAHAIDYMSYPMTILIPQHITDIREISMKTSGLITHFAQAFHSEPQPDGKAVRYDLILEWITVEYIYIYIYTYFTAAQPSLHTCAKIPQRSDNYALEEHRL